MTNVAPKYQRWKAFDVKEISIRGRIYDIKDFISIHPGGAVIASKIHPPSFGYPADVTDIFDAMHSQSKDAKTWLAKLAQQGNTRAWTKQELERREAREGKYDVITELYRKETENLKKAGLFEPSRIHAFYRLFEVLFLTIFGAMCVVWPGKYIGYWGGGFIITLATQRLGWTMHECAHGSLFRVPWLDNMIGNVLLSVVAGMSPGWWKHNHNRHHATTQHHGFDPDMNTAPLVAFDSHTVKSVPEKMYFWFRHQASLYFLTTFLGVIAWLLTVHPIFVYKKRRYGDALGMVLHWIIWFKVFNGPCGGYWGAFIFHLWSLGFTGIIIFTNFALSHSTHPVLEHDDREGWVHSALYRTVDFHSHPGVFGGLIDRFVEWWMGFLNYQVAHHLWPSMPQFRQRSPLVRDAILKLAAADPDGVLNYNVTTYWQGLKDLFDNLATIAREHLSGKPVEIVHPTGRPYKRWIYGYKEA